MNKINFLNYQLTHPKSSKESVEVSQVLPLKKISSVKSELNKQIEDLKELTRITSPNIFVQTIIIS